METFVGLRAGAAEHCHALFRVRTSFDDVYMAVIRSNYGNEERAVVEVERERFFALWRRDPQGSHAAYADGSMLTWRVDGRFDLATEGFSFGEYDPVPLAEVRCAGGETPWVALSDGVIRTVWLAAHGASCFPVECRVDEAPRLARHAGTGAHKWRRVAELIPVAPA
ncbi:MULTISPECIES: plasmid fertility inhibition factor family protein [Paraburkholderia]|uniref:DOMON-like domain-containing protein n=1 Tax=Paraburkholderia tropica TaxID=92647 RepID=A0ABX5MVX5_9BURK|nr:hypothetical protein [Paraburkholderia tropica]MBB2999301.1 hypothetical protein [Paraburkholderia tropica]MBB6318799.1 hypothetical protein [Paraburkholderia tropica]MDE1139027.1 hypothetical protein [Paraburkholderia tropica]PXX18601.1 hypothetical protein C7400_104111 [Paraburkholderia tropica]PZW87134.1 hypothetical protein C7399_104111 [Paraburkholderia tropica]